ncbi:hypothetical protein Tco_1062864, partial [Tanacetum coccineum]
MLPPNNLGPDESGVSVNETLFRGFVLKAYSDSDYAGCNLDRKSTSGGCQILGGKLVCWSAKKKSSVAMSSVKAEYVAAAGCCAQVLWIKSQLADYDVLYDKPLAEPNFTRLVAELGMLNIEKQVSECTESIIGFNNAVALLEHSNGSFRPMLSFLFNYCINKALTLKPTAMYVEYLKEFWYTTEVEEETKTIIFLLSWWDKPMSLTQDEFISAIGLPICRDDVPLPPKETIRAGLATLGLFDKDKPTLLSTVFVNSSPLKTMFLSLMFENLLGKDYVSNDFTLVKPHTITATSFQKPLASEVPLTSQMLKVAKLSEEASLQPVTQSKAPTNLKTKKKRILPSSKPKSPYRVRVILPKKQFAKTQHAEVTEATADATKSLVASESAEEQGNQPSTAKAEKVLDQNVEMEKDVEFMAMEEVAELQSLEIPTVDQLLDEADKLNKATMHDSEETADNHEDSDSDLQSMLDDDLRSVLRFNDANSDDTQEHDTSDHIFPDDNASAVTFRIF